MLGQSNPFNRMYSSDDSIFLQKYVHISPEFIDHFLEITMHHKITFSTFSS